MNCLGGLALKAGIADVAARGVLTPPSLQELFALTMEMLDGETPEGYLADFRRAACAITAADLDALMKDARPEAVVPAALLVSPGAAQPFIAHGLAMAHRGILRPVFTDEPSARAWLQVRQQIAAHQRRHSAR